MNNSLTREINRLIAEAYNESTNKSPASFWKAVCNTLLKSYPPDHIAWGYGKLTPSGWPENSETTYNLVKCLSFKHLRSWKELEELTYSIAQQSVSFDTQCSEIADALREAHFVVYENRRAQRRKNLENWNKLTHCRWCWRLAPAKSGIKYQTCERHKPRTKDYQKAYRCLPPADIFPDEVYEYWSKHRETFKSKFLSSVLRQDMITSSGLDSLRSIFPHAINYICNSQHVYILTLKQLIKGLVGDSVVNNKENIIHIHKKMLEMEYEPREVLNHLILCEIWLSSLTIRRPIGGKRTGAGRDQNKTNRLLSSKNDILSDLHNSTMTKTEIAKKYGVSRSTVYEILKKENIQPEKPVD